VVKKPPSTRLHSIGGQRNGDSRRRGCPNITWWRLVEKEIKQMGKTWRHSIHGKGPADVA